MVVVSIADSFQYSDSQEILTIRARLDDGNPLPMYIVYNPDTQEFYIDGQMARNMGIDEVVVVLEAEDTAGNSVVTRFRIQVDAEDVELEGSETAFPQAEDVGAEEASEAAAATEESDNVESDQDFAKENLNKQVLRAGEFGYQQEKMELKTLLEKIFSRG